MCVCVWVSSKTEVGLDYTLFYVLFVITAECYKILQEPKLTHEMISPMEMEISKRIRSTRRPQRKRSRCDKPLKIIARARIVLFLSHWICIWNDANIFDHDIDNCVGVRVSVRAHGFFFGWKLRGKIEHKPIFNMLYQIIATIVMQLKAMRCAFLSEKWIRIEFVLTSRNSKIILRRLNEIILRLKWIRADIFLLKTTIPFFTFVKAALTQIHNEQYRNEKIPNKYMRPAIPPTGTCSNSNGKSKRQSLHSVCNASSKGNCFHFS